VIAPAGIEVSKRRTEVSDGENEYEERVSFDGRIEAIPEQSPMRRFTIFRFAQLYCTSDILGISVFEVYEYSCFISVDAIL
jgi:hypothetical protein